MTRKIRGIWRRFLRLVLIVLCFLLAALCIYPMLITVSGSFMSRGELRINYGGVFDSLNGDASAKTDDVNLKLIPDRVTFSQYKKVLLQTSDYLMKFWNSVIYVFPISVFQLLIALFAAYGFSRSNGKACAMIFYAYICLMLLPTQVTLVPNYLVSRRLNIIDTRSAIWLPAFFAPFSVYLITKYMKRIPREIRDAAYVDGAGSLKTLMFVYIPMSRSIISACFMLVFFDYWNMVEQPLVLLNDSDMYPLSIWLSKIGEKETEVAFALAVIYMLPGFLAFLYGSEDLIEGISCQGSVKG